MYMKLYSITILTSILPNHKLGEEHSLVWCLTLIDEVWLGVRVFILLSFVDGDRKMELGVYCNTRLSVFVVYLSFSVSFQENDSSQVQLNYSILFDEYGG